jgi:hypothetical protein
MIDVEHRIKRLTYESNKHQRQKNRQNQNESFHTDLIFSDIQKGYMGFCVSNYQICWDRLELCGLACLPHLRLDGLEEIPAPSLMECFYRQFISKYLCAAQTVDLAWGIPTHTKPHRPYKNNGNATFSSRRLVIPIGQVMVMVSEKTECGSFPLFLTELESHHELQIAQKQAGPQRHRPCERQ